MSRQHLSYLLLYIQNKSVSEYDSQTPIKIYASDLAIDRNNIISFVFNGTNKISTNFETQIKCTQNIEVKSTSFLLNCKYRFAGGFDSRTLSIIFTAV